MSHPEKKSRERRHNKRITINEEVFDQTSGESLGYTGDINANGMMLIGTTAFEIGKEIRIRINIPDGKKETNRVSLTAQCRWCEPHLDTDFFNSGFQFKYLNFDIEYINTLLSGLAN